MHRLAQDDNNVLLGQDCRPVEEEVCRRYVGQRHSLDERIRRDSEAHVDLYLSNCLLVLCTVTGACPRGALQDYCSCLPMKRACRINPASMTLLSAAFLSRSAVRRSAVTNCYLSRLPSSFLITIIHFIYLQHGEGAFTRRIASRGYGTQVSPHP
jgi:hypothetical protein